MATGRYVVNLALQKLGILAAGREARTPDATDALAALEGLYGAWIAGGAFGRLTDVVPQGNLYVTAGNERIIRESADVLEVVLPELVSDQWVGDYGHGPSRYYGTVVTVTTDGDTTTVDVAAAQPISYAVPPRDGSVVSITDRVGGQTLYYMYDGTVKTWQALSPLILDDQMPRSSADPQGLAACLAIEISDSYGSAATIGPATAMQAARFKTAMVSRFSMPRIESAGVFV